MSTLQPSILSINYTSKQRLPNWTTAAKRTPGAKQCTCIMVNSHRLNAALISAATWMQAYGQQNCCTTELFDFQLVVWNMIFRHNEAAAQSFLFGAKCAISNRNHSTFTVPNLLFFAMTSRVTSAIFDNSHPPLASCKKRTFQLYLLNLRRTRTQMKIYALFLGERDMNQWGFWDAIAHRVTSIYQTWTT